MEQIKEKLMGFMKRYFKKRDILEEEDLSALGFVNSLFSMQLILFLEKEFNITIENEDMELENFKSIKNIVNLVARKTQAA